MAEKAIGQSGAIGCSGNRETDWLSRRVINPEIRLRQFGFIFQDFKLLSVLTALKNVAIVAELAGVKGSVARRKATELFTDLGLGERLNFVPEKHSGGEKQRVAIPSALVNDPALILVDEPTANLDSRIGHEIMRLLRSIARLSSAEHEQGRSGVIVSRDQRVKDIADRVIWLEDGEFKEMVTEVRRFVGPAKSGGETGERTATDPVCGMAAEREKAIEFESEGHIFYFCARACRDEFVNHPEQFISSG